MGRRPEVGSVQISAKSRDYESERLANRSYTILVVPDRSAQTRKFRVQKTLLVRTAAALGVLLLAAVGMVVHYFYVVGQVVENRVLREENAQLRTQVKLVHEKVASVTQTLDTYSHVLPALEHKATDELRNLLFPANPRPAAVYAIWSNGEIEEPTATALSALFGESPKAWIELSHAFVSYRANEVAQSRQTQTGWLGRRL